MRKIKTTFFFNEHIMKVVFPLTQVTVTLAPLNPPAPMHANAVTHAAYIIRMHRGRRIEVYILVNGS